MNPRVSLVIGILCISFSPIFVKLAGVSPLGAAFYRVAIAWACLLPYCIIKNKLRIGRKQLLISIAAGMVFASDVAVWNVSLLKISATVSTLLANLAPVWVGLIGYLLFRAKSGRQFWIGTFIAIIGMVVLVGYRAHTYTSNSMPASCWRYWPVFYMPATSLSPKTLWRA
jgi:drug/metabolite transporter (DMT)-like permease